MTQDKFTNNGAEFYRKRAEKRTEKRQNSRRRFKLSVPTIMEEVPKRINRFTITKVTK